MNHTKTPNSEEENLDSIKQKLAEADNQILKQANTIKQLEVQLAHLANQIPTEAPNKKQGLEVNSRQLNLILDNIPMNGISLFL